MSSFGNKIRKLDMYQKISHDVSQGTNIGGLISIFTAIIMIGFLITQIKLYVNPPLTAQILQDDFFTRNQMTINLDITFPRFPCQIISLDLQDIMLSHHPNIGSIKKWRLDPSGRYLDNSDFQLMRQKNPQKQYDLAKSAFQRNLGCRLKGSFTVKQVPGNFHISCHSYANIFTRLKNQKIFEALDVSHTIHHLYFGEIGNIQALQKAHPESSLQGLQNFSVNLDAAQIQSHGAIKKSKVQHYHIDLVPTKYQQSVFSSINAFQYTFNHNSYEVFQMPSVYFNYHIGGLSVNITKNRSDFLTFLIKLCAVVGGTYTLASLLDTILHRITGGSKIDLGK